MKYTPFTFHGHKWIPSMGGIKVAVSDTARKEGSPEMVAGWTCATIPGAAITVAGVEVNDVVNSTSKCSLTHMPSGLAMPGRGSAKAMAELAQTMVADLGADFTVSEKVICDTLPKHKLWEMFQERVRMGAFGRIVNNRPDLHEVVMGYRPASEWVEFFKALPKGASVRIMGGGPIAVDLHGDVARLQSNVKALLVLNPDAWCSLDVRRHVPIGYTGATPMGGNASAIMDIIGKGIRVQAIVWTSAELDALVVTPCEGQADDDEREAM